MKYRIIVFIFLASPLAFAMEWKEQELPKERSEIEMLLSTSDRDQKKALINMLKELKSYVEELNKQSNNAYNPIITSLKNTIKKFKTKAYRLPLIAGLYNYMQNLKIQFLQKYEEIEGFSTPQGYAPLVSATIKRIVETLEGIMKKKIPAEQPSKD